MKIFLSFFLLILSVRLLSATDTLKIMNLYNQAQFEIEMCRYKKAENLLIEAIRLDSLNTKLHFAMANNYQAMNNKKLALRSYDAIIRISPENQAAKIQKAKVLIQLGDINKALDLYIQLEKSDSLNPFYVRQKAWCYYKKEVVDTAILFYNKAYRIDTTDINTVISLGRLYLNENMITQGNLLCLTHLITDTGNTDLYFLYGQLCYKSDCIGEAIKYFEKVLARHDSAPEKIKYAGLAYYEFKNYKPAISLFQKFLTADPENHFVWYKLADAYLKTENTDSAFYCIKQCLSVLEPDKRYHGSVYLTMGLIYEKNSKLDEALVCYNKAQQLNADDPGCYYRIGYLAEIFEKDISKAIANYELCVKKIEAKIIPGTEIDGSNPMFDNSKKRLKILNEYKNKSKKTK